MDVDEDGLGLEALVHVVVDLEVAEALVPVLRLVALRPHDGLHEAVETEGAVGVTQDLRLRLPGRAVGVLDFRIVKSGGSSPTLRQLNPGSDAKSTVPRASRFGSRRPQPMFRTTTHVSPSPRRKRTRELQSEFNQRSGLPRVKASMAAKIGSSRDSPSSSCHAFSHLRSPYSRR